MLIAAENSEKQNLHVNYQKHYRSTLLQNFHEVSKGIELLPPVASYEALLELLGLAEHRGQLRKNYDVGLDLIEILADRFTVSLFGVFVKRIIDSCEAGLEAAVDENNNGLGAGQIAINTANLKQNLACRNSILKYLDSAMGALTAFQRDNLQVAKPIIRLQFLADLMDKHGVYMGLGLH